MWKCPWRPQPGFKQTWSRQPLATPPRAAAVTGPAILRTVVGLCGLLLVAVVFQDVFEVMLLPRRIQRRLRLVRFYYRWTWRAWITLSPAGDRNGTFLSHFGALSMVLLFAIWTTALVGGFGLMHWAVQGVASNRPLSPLSEQIYLSGATFFTLGYGDVTPHSGLSRFLAVAESGLGIGFIAMVISYLPVIHQFFSRREAFVMQMDGRAGSPPTAATLLARHADPADLPHLDDYLREGERWASELLESHLSYPMLAYYRSQHENQSWLGALGCMLDTAALVLVGLDDVRPLQARLTFSAARQVLVEMARTFGITPSRFTGGDRLDQDSYDRLEQTLSEAGLRWRGGPVQRDTLAALRATYEPLLHALAMHLRTAVPTWLPNETADNWEHGPRGLMAGRLVEELSNRAAPLASGESVPLARRLLRRLRTEREPQSS